MDPESFSQNVSWINTLLLLATIAAVGVVVLAVYKGWREDHALHYFNHSGHSAVISDITVNLNGIPHQEHCLTCHPQGRAANLPGRAKPVKEHPDIAPHSIYELGCTGCHLGEGMARDLVISHGVPGIGARQILAGEALQASCYTCHELKPLQGAEKAWDGAGLFSVNACDTCHGIKGQGGGNYGPDLSQLGSFLGLKEIQKAIEDPRADPENSIMPKFSLSPEQVKAISYFLKSRVKDPPLETPMARVARLKRESRSGEEVKVSGSGKEILQQKKCLACHKFQDEDGQIGPDLTHIAYIRNPAYIRNFLHNPGKEIPGAIMPWVKMTKGEENRLVGTLEQNESGGGHLHGKSPKHLYMMLCQRCHAAQGDGMGIIQPNLANFPRAFWKNAEFFRRIPDERIVKSIEKGIAGTSMPPYGELLGKDRVNSLIDLIFREFVRIPRPEKKTDLFAPPRPATLFTAEKTDKEYRRKCSSCHGIAGTGKGPDYLTYLPRPRDLTNHPYFQSISDERMAMGISHGVPGTAMPSFSGKIPPEGIWSLINKVRELSGTTREASHAG